MNRGSALALAAVVLAGIIWFAQPESSSEQPDASVAVKSETLPEPPPLLEGPITLGQLADPGASPHQKIHRVHGLLQNYVTVMKSRGGPPLSTNAEFTRALTGSNRLGSIFLASDNPAISPAGELIDAWGSPYFFHVLAADAVEIVSAGPDRIPFNSDDLIFPQSPNENSLGSSRDNE